jgi:hypothetical protein
MIKNQKTNNLNINTISKEKEVLFYLNNTTKS